MSHFWPILDETSQTPKTPLFTFSPKPRASLPRSWPQDGPAAPLGTCRYLGAARASGGTIPSAGQVAASMRLRVPIRPCSPASNFTAAKPFAATPRGQESKSYPLP